jgi:hypothetical protein
MPRRILDQDDFVVSPIVWYGSGEVVGNWVVVTIRDFEGLFNWFARVEDTMGYRVAKTGLKLSYEEAFGSAMHAVCEMLEVEDEEE